ncbi:MAG: YraN family protein [Parvularculaceae bacterium]|nr:YraN family protein [Parvularculaceae bacterium]
MPAPSSSRRQLAEHRGRVAEAIAAWTLRLKGYRILAERFAAPGGEIDIVAQRGSTLIFVEVKYRKNLEKAWLSVTPRNQWRIKAAAAAWLARKARRVDVPLRFDIFALAPWRIRHHRDAFR